MKNRTASCWWQCWLVASVFWLTPLWWTWVKTVKRLYHYGYFKWNVQLLTCFCLTVVYFQIDVGVAWRLVKEDVDSSRDDICHCNDSSSNVRLVFLLLWLSTREKDTWLLWFSARETNIKTIGRVILLRISARKTTLWSVWSELFRRVLHVDRVLPPQSSVITRVQLQWPPWQFHDVGSTSSKIFVTW